MARDELQVIDRTYQLLKWFLERLAEFPRSHRYRLDQQIERRLCAVFNELLRAKCGAGVDKREALTNVNLQLESLRMLCQLAQELALAPGLRSHCPGTAPLIGSSTPLYT